MSLLSVTIVNDPGIQGTAEGHPRDTRGTTGDNWGTTERAGQALEAMREPGEEELEDTTEALCAKEAGRIKLQGNYELKGYLKDIKCGHSMSRMAVSSEAGVIFVADPSGGVAVGLLDEKFAQNFISLSKKEKDGGVGADGFTRGLLADQRFSAVELSPDGRILGCLGRRNLVLLNVRYVLELVSERKASKNM
eukprot:1377922-Amorphochlora_amoeboformis.AAC.1